MGYSVRMMRPNASFSYLIPLKYRCSRLTARSRRVSFVIETSEDLQSWNPSGGRYVLESETPLGDRMG